MTRGKGSWWIPLVATFALVGSGLWMLVQGVGAWGSVAREGSSSSAYGSMMAGGGEDHGSMMGRQREDKGSMMDCQDQDSMMGGKDQDQDQDQDSMMGG